MNNPNSGWLVVRFLYRFLFALVLGGAIAGPATRSVAAPTSYHIEAQLAPVCLTGTFPLTIQTSSGAQVGSLTLAVGAAGAVSGNLALGGATLTVAGKAKFNGATGTISLKATSGANTVTLKGKLSGGTFAGKASAKGSVATGATTFVLNVSGAPPLVLTVAFTLEFDAKGKGTGTGTATGCGLNTPVTVTATLKAGKVKVNIVGDGIKISGKGVASGADFDLTLKLAGAGARATVITTASSKALVTISLKPVNATILVGGTQQYSVIGTYSDSTTSDLTTTATYNSSVTAVATIASGGLASGVSTGTVTITATVGTAVKTTSLTVVSTDIGTLIALARARLEAADAAGAGTLFALARGLDGSNHDANFGVGLTSLLLVTGDPAVSTLIQQLGQQPPTAADIFAILAGTKSLKDFFGFAPVGAVPQVSAAQDVLCGTLVPVLTNAIARLRSVENTGYVFEVTPAMVNRASVTDSILLDDGEFYAADGTLSQLVAWMQIICAYNLDASAAALADPGAALKDPISLLAGNASFFTLKTDGPARLLLARTALGEATTQLGAGYAFLRSNDVDAATDNGLRLPLRDYNHDGGVDSTDADVRDTFVNFVILGALHDSFVNLGEICLAPSSNVCINIDANQFFVSPIDRTKLPPLGYDLAPDATLSELLGRPTHARICNADTDSNGDPCGDDDDEFADSVTQAFGPLPDPTFNGLFPDGVFAIPGQPHDGLLVMSSAVYSTNVTGFGFVQVCPSVGGSNLLVGVSTKFQTNATISTVNPATGSSAAAVVTTEMGFIMGLAVHQGDLWASGSFSDPPGSANFLFGIVQLNPNGTIADFFEDLAIGDSPGALASDGTTLWVVTSGANGNGTAISSFDPLGGTLGSVIFDTEDSAFTGRAFAKRPIDGLASDGTSLYLTCGNIIVKITTAGTVVSERKPLGAVPRGTAYLGGKLCLVGNYRIDAFVP